MVELIIGILGGAASLIGAVWGIIKYYDQKRTKAQQTKEEQDKQDRIEQKETLQYIKEHLKKAEQDNAAQRTDIANLQREVIEVKTQLTTIARQVTDAQETIDENEMDRLRSDIIGCLDKIENGLTISSVDLQHVHHCYDKYVGKHGNSYIEDCMEFITEYERECRELGIAGFEPHGEK